MDKPETITTNLKTYLARLQASAATLDQMRDRVLGLEPPDNAVHPDISSDESLQSLVGVQLRYLSDRIETLTARINDVL